MSRNFSALNEEELSHLQKLKIKWTPEQLKKEAYGEFKPTGAFLAHLKYQRWRYQHNKLNEGTK